MYKTWKVIQRREEGKKKKTFLKIHREKRRKKVVRVAERAKSIAKIKEIEEIK